MPAPAATDAGERPMNKPTASRTVDEYMEAIAREARREKMRAKLRDGRRDEIEIERLVDEAEANREAEAKREVESGRDAEAGREVEAGCEAEAQAVVDKVMTGPVAVASCKFCGGELEFKVVKPYGYGAMCLIGVPGLLAVLYPLLVTSSLLFSSPMRATLDGVGVSGHIAFFVSPLFFSPPGAVGLWLIAATIWMGTRRVRQWRCMQCEVVQ